jgi:hypothetical protein
MNGSFIKAGKNLLLDVGKIQFASIKNVWSIKTKELWFRMESTLD